MGPLTGRGMHKAATSVKQETVSVEWKDASLTEDHGLTHS